MLQTGCPAPPPSSNHPLLQNTAVWICDNPEMYFEVNINDKEVLHHEFRGEINKDGVVTEIKAYISGASSIDFSLSKEMK